MDGKGLLLSLEDVYSIIEGNIINFLLILERIEYRHLKTMQLCTIWGSSAVTYI
jgi:hypothetical protein